MKETTRQKRHDEMLAKLLQISVEEVQAQRQTEEQDDKSREAQAVHLFLEKPDAFISKECKNCTRLFLTTYKFVAYCSNRCLGKSLAEIGIDWNPYHTPEDRWRRAKIPTGYTIPPEALEILMQIAENSQSLSSLSDNPEQSYNGPHISQDQPLLESYSAVAED